MLKLDPKPCLNCERSFQPNRDWQKFCNRSCRDQFHDRTNPRLRKFLWQIGQGGLSAATTQAMAMAGQPAKMQKTEPADFSI
jgi:hypothetical protein